MLPPEVDIFADIAIIMHFPPELPPMITDSPSIENSIEFKEFTGLELSTWHVESSLRILDNSLYF